MTIERMHFENGYPLKFSGKTINSQIEDIYIFNQHKIKTLPEGEYNLTPQWWVKDFVENSLSVFKDGSAIYKTIPLNDEVITVDYDQEGIGRRKSGKQILHLPTDVEITVVVGPLEDKPSIGVYDIILYNPGDSPKKQ